MNLKAQTLLDAFSHLPTGATIVEIGSVRFAHEIPSDGWSTVHLAEAAKARGWTLHSVDIDVTAADTARDATRGLPVTVHQADGENWLLDCELTIDGLYLDGSADPAQTLAQYEAAELADRAVVVIDDVQPIGPVTGGKGDLLLDRLPQDGFTLDILTTEPGYLMAVANRHA